MRSCNQFCHAFRCALAGGLHRPTDPVKDNAQTQTKNTVPAGPRQTLCLWVRYRAVAEEKTVLTTLPVACDAIVASPTSAASGVGWKQSLNQRAEAAQACKY